MKCDKKLCVFLIEADANIHKPLRNLCTPYGVNTLKYCGEMFCVEENLHTFGNSDITTKRMHKLLPLRVDVTLKSLVLVVFPPRILRGCAQD